MTKLQLILFCVIFIQVLLLACMIGSWQDLHGWTPPSPGATSQYPPIYLGWPYLTAISIFAVDMLAGLLFLTNGLRMEEDK
jgi:hypothetical protein